MSIPGGRYLIAEFFQCPVPPLKDQRRIHEMLIKAALLTGNMITGCIMQEGPCAEISSLILLRGSHLALHTFPQGNYASLAMFSCDTRLNLNEAYNHIANELQATWSLVKELTLGNEEMPEK